MIHIQWWLRCGPAYDASSKYTGLSYNMEQQIVLKLLTVVSYSIGTNTTAEMAYQTSQFISRVFANWEVDFRFWRVLFYPPTPHVNWTPLENDARFSFLDIFTKTPTTVLSIIT